MMIFWVFHHLEKTSPLRQWKRHYKVVLTANNGQSLQSCSTDPYSLWRPQSEDFKELLRSTNFESMIKCMTKTFRSGRQLHKLTAYTQGVQIKDDNYIEVTASTQYPWNKIQGSKVTECPASIHMLLFFCFCFFKFSYLFYFLFTVLKFWI